MSCDICAYAAEHGSWPADHGPTHCTDCHRSWHGKREAHCAAPLEDGSVCCLHFSADSVADKHRVGGRCLSPSEMLRLRTEAGNPVLRVVDTPTGPTWRNYRVMELKPAFAVKDIA